MTVSVQMLRFAWKTLHLHFTLDFAFFSAKCCTFLQSFPVALPAAGSRKNLLIWQADECEFDSGLRDYVVLFWLDCLKHCPSTTSKVV